MTRVGLYARVSTRDKGQDPELQLHALREYAARRGLEIVGEFVDRAPAGDRARRREWARLLELAERRQVDLVLVWRLDRAFRSTVDALATLRQLDHRGVGFAVLDQPELDTTSPVGRLLFTMLAAFAELERSMIADRVREGMARARREGRVLGRPSAMNRRGVKKRASAVLAAAAGGEISISQAARELRWSRATVRAHIQRLERGAQ